MRLALLLLLFAISTPGCRVAVAQQENLAPVCDFAAPDQDQIVENQSVVVRVSACDDKAPPKLRVLINGTDWEQLKDKAIELGDKEVPDEKQTPERPFVTRLSLTIPLPAIGVYTLQAIATDASGVITNAQRTIRRVATSRRLWVWSLGISHYRNPQHDITGAAEDAQRVGDALSGPNTLWEPMTDDSADSESARNRLEAIKEQIKADDTLLIFLSCHVVQEQGEHYLLLQDSLLTDLPGTALSVRNLEATLAALNAHVFIFADVSHAGALLGPRQASYENLQDFLRKLGLNRNVVWMLGGRFDQSSQSVGGKGVLSQVLSSGLKGQADANGDKYITPLELNDYVSREGRRLSGNRQEPGFLLPPNFDPGEVLLTLPPIPTRRYYPPMFGTYYEWGPIDLGDK